VEKIAMASVLRQTIIATALMASCASAMAADGAAPVIDQMTWDKAETICFAWPVDASPKTEPTSGLSWIGLPASVRPFGMRAYMSIDGVVHPLRQIAYANRQGTLSIYYQTLGDRHYDVYLTLSGDGADQLKGQALSGTLVAARFGIYTEIKIAGSCG
jgi:hypothetical protein